MKAITLTIFLSFVASYAQNLDYERAMEFSKKYQLSETNTNIADVDYAREFKEIAADKIKNKFQNLQGNKADLSKYKEFEKIQKIMDQRPKDKNNITVSPQTDAASLKNQENENKSTQEVYIEEKEVVYYEVENAQGVTVIVEDEESLQNIIEDKNKKEEKQNQEEAFMENILLQNEILDKDNIFTDELEKIEQLAKENEKNQLTFFYFASSDLKLQQFNNFIAHIDKLKNKGYDIVGRVFFRGLIEDSFDAMANWIRDKEDKGMIRSPNVHYQFHPWAYDYFLLNKVPAYALSNCKSDFRFKECNHRFLAKGNISFERFTEILKENNEREFNTLYLDTIDINEVIYENN